MKRAVLSGGVALILTITSFTGLGSVAHAAGATNFLDALHSEVTNRVANPGTNSAAQKAALRAASNVLGRDTKTLSADLSALAKAAGMLDPHFAGDATLLSLEENTLAAYSNEAHVKLDGAKVRLEGFSNAVPRRVLSQFRQATNALAGFDANTNDVPSRARALARVFNKMRNPVAKIFEKYPHPAGQSPTEIETSLNLDLGFDFNTLSTGPTTYFCDTTSDGMTRSLTYFCNSPAEAGTWEYFKTGVNTATVRCTPSSPPGLAAHDFLLVFTTTRVGTFSGRNAQGQVLQGTFLID
jgi:hypothetical protein